MSRSHPQNAVKPAEVEVEIPDGALEDAVHLYKRKYGNPDPLEQNVNEAIRKVISLRFVTEDGRLAADVAGERCSWEVWDIVCPDCGNEWSGKADAGAAAVEGFQPAAKAEDYWICEQCEEFFER